MNKTKKNRKSYKKKIFNKKSINFKNNKSRYNKKSKKKYLKGGRTWWEYGATWYKPANLTKNIISVAVTHFGNQSSEDYYTWLKKDEDNNSYNLAYIISHDEIKNFQQKIIMSYFDNRGIEINTQNNAPIPRKDHTSIQTIDQDIYDFFYYIIYKIIDNIEKSFIQNAYDEKKNNLDILDEINTIIRNIFVSVEWANWFGFNKNIDTVCLQKSSLIRSIIKSYCSMIRFLCIYDINAHTYSIAPHSNMYLLQKFSQTTRFSVPPKIFSTLIPKIVKEISKQGYNDILTIKSTITSNTPIGATINITKNIIATIPIIKDMFYQTASNYYKIDKHDVNTEISTQFKNFEQIKNFVNEELNVLYEEVKTAESNCKFSYNCNR